MPSSPAGSLGGKGPKRPAAAGRRWELMVVAWGRVTAMASAAHSLAVNTACKPRSGPCLNFPPCRIWMRKAHKMLISYLTQGKSLLPFFLLRLYFYSYTKQTEESKVKRAEESGRGGGGERKQLSSTGSVPKCLQQQRSGGQNSNPRLPHEWQEPAEGHYLLRHYLIAHCSMP